MTCSLNNYAQHHSTACITITPQVIYTDGLAAAGIKEGGSAAIISTGYLNQPGIEMKIMLRGAAFTTSFKEELQAIYSAVSLCIDNKAPTTHTLIATDSYSLCHSLLGGTTDPLSTV